MIQFSEALEREGVTYLHQSSDVSLCRQEALLVVRCVNGGSDASLHFDPLSVEMHDDSFLRLTQKLLLLLPNQPQLFDRQCVHLEAGCVEVGRIERATKRICLETTRQLHKLRCFVVIWCYSRIWWAVKR